MFRQSHGSMRAEDLRLRAVWMSVAKRSVALVVLGMVFGLLTPVAAHAAGMHRRHREGAAVVRVHRRARHGMVRAAMHGAARGVPGERFSVPSLIGDPGAGDVTAGEDQRVRAAAVEALGNMNGTVVAIDPRNGRILAMVNQKLALSPGAEPCSTIKVAVALAGLDAGLVHADTPVNLGGHYTLDMTHALARSVNLYFEVLGRSLGFERMKQYANEFGLGELAGWNIAGEQLGVYPSVELPERQGGVGRMCSFGESISMTPLQLGALVSAIANGGTLYYLQHPTSEAEAAAFVPKVKRQLDIANVIPEILPGMEGAVNYPLGTAHSLHQNFNAFPVFGKTGTCSNHGIHYGWFVSYGQAPTGPIVTVMFVQGAYGQSGPKAAELTGVLYRGMEERNVFLQQTASAPASAADAAASETASAQ